MMRRIKRKLMAGSASALLGIGGCLFNEAQDSCEFDLLDWNVTGECMVDVDISDLVNGDDN